MRSTLSSSGPFIFPDAPSFAYFIQISNLTFLLPVLLPHSILLTWASFLNVSFEYHTIPGITVKPFSHALSDILLYLKGELFTFQLLPYCLVISLLMVFSSITHQNLYSSHSLLLGFHDALFLLKMFSLLLYVKPCLTFYTLKLVSLSNSW